MRRGVMAGLAVTAALATGCGSDDQKTPEKTVRVYFRAVAAGDGAKACSLLSKAEQHRTARRASCKRSIDLLGPLIASILRRVKVVGVSTHGDRATVTVANGAARSRLILHRSNGKWLIVGQPRAGSTGSGSSGAPASAGPTAADVDRVVKCLNPTFGVVSNFGSDTIGGVRHAVLTVEVGRAQLEVFASPADARRGLAGLQSYFRTRARLKPVGRSIAVYIKPIPVAKQRKLEACG